MNKRLGVKLGLACCGVLVLCALAGHLAVAKLEVGKAVEVTLKSGWAVKGKVLRISTDSVTLDVSSGAAASSGTLTVASDSIISVRPIDKVPVFEPTTPAPRPPKPEPRTPTPSPTPSPEAERHELLKKFPPEDGWGKEKLEDIKWRQIILSLFPSPEEKEFIEAFDEWEKAWEAEEKEKAKPEKEGKEAEDKGKQEESEKEEGTKEQK
jgi:hypothetical protein